MNYPLKEKGYFLFQLFVSPDYSVNHALIFLRRNKTKKQERQKMLFFIIIQYKKGVKTFLLLFSNLFSVEGVKDRRDIAGQIKGYQF
jgi:hypothetical protein